MQQKRFGDVLKSILEEKDITAYRLRVDTGIDKGALSRILNNQTNPSYENFIKIVNYPEFRDCTDRLLGREGVK